MSNPSFSNIDRWLFELLEGNLSPEQIAQLESFLLQHPELDVDKDVWAQAKVDQQEYVYPHQDKLIRRRPVGLYSAVGFFTIALLVSLSIYSNSNSDFTSDFAIANNKIELPQDQLGIVSSFQSLNQRPSRKLNNSDTQHNQSLAQLNSSSYKHSLTSNSTPSISFKHESKQKPLNKIPELLGLNGETSNVLSDELQLVNLSINKLKAHKAKRIEITENGTSDFTSNKRANRFAKTDYKVTLGSRIHKMGRSLQRMLDNPIALRNQRDPYYHVPGMQAMDVNFGSVGTMLATRVQTVSRVQWLGEENQQLMNQLSIDGYSYGMRGGIGLQMNHSYYGTGGIENYYASFTYSPKFSVARSVTVEPSVRFKMGSKILNANNITPGSMVEFDRSNTQGFFLDGSVPMGKQLWYKDLGLGLMVNTKWFHMGIQGDNLFRHYDNIYSNSLIDPRRVGTHFVATIGTDYQSIRKTVTVSPYVVYQQQENLKEAWMGANLRLKWLTVGAAVSSNLEPAASLGLKFQHFAITYNADLTQSQLLNQKSFSHQLTLRFVSKPSRIGQRLLN
ncbi:MAG: Type secretion system rane protein PorP/SprF [Bacteroidota bacterium]|jgi:hypothetical protein